MGIYSRSEKATAGSRILASLLDGLITGAPIGVFASLSPKTAVIGQIIGVAYAFTKDALPFLDGQSLGKKIMNIRVVDEAGNPITNDYGKAAIRQLALSVPILNFIECFMILGESGRRFGDQWAKTRVVVNVPAGGEEDLIQDIGKPEAW